MKKSESGMERPAEDQSSPAGPAGGPAPPRGARPGLWHEHPPRAAAVDVEEGLGPAGRRGGQSRVRTAGGGRREALWRRAGDTGEDLVPYAVRPGTERAVADVELLLRTIDDLAVEPEIGDEPATGERRA